MGEERVGSNTIGSQGINTEERLEFRRDIEANPSG